MDLCRYSLDAFKCCLKINPLVLRLCFIFNYPFVYRLQKRPIFIVVKEKYQGIPLSLNAGHVQFQFVAELSFKDGWEEGGAEREL